jgi:hypothetical protein
MRRFDDRNFHVRVVVVWVWLAAWVAGALALTLATSRLPETIWLYWTSRGGPAWASQVSTSTIVPEAWIPAIVLLAVAIELTVVAALALRPAGRGIALLTGQGMTGAITVVIGVLILYCFFAGETDLMSVPRQVGRPPLPDENAAVRTLGPFSSHTSIIVNVLLVVVVIIAYIASRRVRQRTDLAARGIDEPPAE